MTDKCNEKVRDGSLWGRYVPCGKPAKEAGKCGIHSPTAVAKRAAKSKALYEAQKEKSPWTAIERLKKRVEELEANQRTPGTVEVCRMLSCECKHQYQWADCAAVNCPIRAERNKP